MQKFAPIFSLLLLLLPIQTGSAILPPRQLRHNSACTPRNMQIALHHKTYTLTASLCQPKKPTQTVLITFHGNTYGSYYWDFPFEPERYSFVDALNKQGYAVLNINRLPVDLAYTRPNPAQPPSSAVTIQSDNAVLHQYVRGLRNGRFGTSFRRVVAVGHSLGGYMLWQAAATYPHDFDGFVITGAVHENSQTATNRVIPLLVPAAQNPKFTHAGLDSGYYAYKPDTRSLYYWLPNTNQHVIEKDNQLMQVTVVQELFSGLALQKTEVSKSIHVPVLVVLGEHDIFACQPDAIRNCTNASVYQAEAPFYSSQSCLQVHVIPASGHDLNLQKNAWIWYQTAGQWLHQFVHEHQPGCGKR